MVKPAQDLPDNLPPIQIQTFPVQGEQQPGLTLFNVNRNYTNQGLMLAIESSGRVVMFNEFPAGVGDIRLTPRGRLLVGFAPAVLNGPGGTGAEITIDEAAGEFRTETGATIKRGDWVSLDGFIGHVMPGTLETITPDPLRPGEGPPGNAPRTGSSRIADATVGVVAEHPRSRSARRSLPSPGRNDPAGKLCFRRP